MDTPLICSLLQQKLEINNTIDEYKKQIADIDRELYTRKECKYFMERFNRRVLEISSDDPSVIFITLNGTDLSNMPKSTQNLQLDDKHLHLKNISFNSDNTITLRYSDK